MSSPRWPVVVFDLDGTLVNTIPLIVASYRHAFRTVRGEEVDEAFALPLIGMTLVDALAPYPEADALAEAYVTFNLAHLESLQTDFEGVPELLDDLSDAGITIGVATSKRRPAAERSVAASGLTGKLRLVSTLEDVAQHKPHPAPLLHALSELGAPAEGSVYVGDAVVDLRAARAAGMDAIAVSWGAGDPAALRAEAPTAYCATVGDLRRVLLG